MRSTRLQLLLLVFASGLSAFSWAVGRLEVAALLAGMAFLCAAALRFALLRRQPHIRWYEGRAAAESLKTLAWRYAVGGDPFSLRTGPDVRAALISQGEAIVRGLRTLRGGLDRSGLYEPTVFMENLRSAPLEERRRAYVAGRIEDQFRWYTNKADWNRRRARLWSAMVLAFQLAGAVGAFLRGFGVLRFDLFGIAGAVAASAAAWLEAKQHGEIASAYQVAADELRGIRKLVHSADTEAEWARFVFEAEEAISREHTMWKATASRTGPASLA